MEIWSFLSLKIYFLSLKTKLLLRAKPRLQNLKIGVNEWECKCVCHNTSNGYLYPPINTKEWKPKLQKGFAPHSWRGRSTIWSGRSHRVEFGAVWGRTGVERPLQNRGLCTSSGVIWSGRSKLWRGRSKLTAFFLMLELDGEGLSKPWRGLSKAYIFMPLLPNFSFALMKGSSCLPLLSLVSQTTMECPCSLALIPQQLQDSDNISKQPIKPSKWAKLPKRR